MLFTTNPLVRFGISIPLLLAYRAGSIVHRALRLRPRIRNPEKLLPLIVIGSLRAGGSGKTPVTLELARLFARQGKRVGVLVYRIGKRNDREDLIEVGAKEDWRASSDEAVLLARESGARIFVTRNRERAWEELSRRSGLDLLISDDGIMDPRLKNAFRILLKRTDEKPQWFNLLPAGPYHLTTSAMNLVNCVVEGPDCEGGNGLWFRRELVFPPDFDFKRKVWALCGLGNPEAFRSDLLKAGVALAGVSAGWDHSLPDLDAARDAAHRKNAEAFVCTAKDWVKLSEHRARLGETFIIGEKITLGSGLISAVSRYLGPPIFVD